MKRARFTALMEVLDQTLTHQQLLELAGWSLVVGGEKLLRRLEDRTEGGEAATSAWQAYRAWKSGSSGSPRPSSSRVLQSWDRLVQEWADVAQEAGVEEGRYWFQEHHWDEPSLDHYTWMADLDAVAVKMEPLLEEAFAASQGQAPPFSFELIEESRLNLPDWMGEMHQDPPDLGPATTRVTLAWGGWLPAAGPDTPAGCRPGLRSPGAG